MFDINVHIERIQNGYIVTENGSQKFRTFFPSLEKFVESEMLEAAKEEDKYFREHDTDGTEFCLRAITSEHVKADSAV